MFTTLKQFFYLIKFRNNDQLLFCHILRKKKKKITSPSLLSPTGSANRRQIKLKSVTLWHVWQDISSNIAMRVRDPIFIVNHHQVPKIQFIPERRVYCQAIEPSNQEMGHVVNAWRTEARTFCQPYTNRDISRGSAYSV